MPATTFSPRGAPCKYTVNSVPDLAGPGAVEPQAAGPSDRLSPDLPDGLQDTDPRDHGLALPRGPVLEEVWGLDDVMASGLLTLWNAESHGLYADNLDPTPPHFHPVSQRQSLEFPAAPGPLYLSRPSPSKAIGRAVSRQGRCRTPCQGLRPPLALSPHSRHPPSVDCHDRLHVAKTYSSKVRHECMSRPVSRCADGIQSPSGSCHPPTPAWKPAGAAALKPSNTELYLATTTTALVIAEGLDSDPVPVMEPGAFWREGLRKYSDSPPMRPASRPSSRACTPSAMQQPDYDPETLQGLLHKAFDADTCGSRARRELCGIDSITSGKADAYHARTLRSTFCLAHPTFRQNFPQPEPLGSEMMHAQGWGGSSSPTVIKTVQVQDSSIARAALQCYRPSCRAFRHNDLGDDECLHIPSINPHPVIPDVNHKSDDVWRRRKTFNRLAKDGARREEWRKKLEAAHFAMEGTAEFRGKADGRRTWTDLFPPGYQ
uniref:Uncharacterized protein n=1 Tax=Eutreptiella gymnastica TaxID=73025 RepID=A0A6U8AQH0_9EUGL|mmetsp:Transcript_16526/g.29419  ORF Transcript_16526/g.29419 Transcript_16526/m.29419 type:complete len:488 (+) Transcript_16526:65-1528(+)